MDSVLARVDAADFKAEHALHLMERGAALRGLDRLEDAEAAYRRALEVIAEQGGTEAEEAPARLGLAAVLTDGGQTEEARPLFEDALRALEEERGARDPERLKGLGEFARLLRATGEHERAAEVEAERR